MAANEITFFPDYAIESTLFISNLLVRPKIHQVLKMRYFADKLHLERFGWMASGDQYTAMKNGPVASQTYDMLKCARGQDIWSWRDMTAQVQAALRVDAQTHEITALRQADINKLSSADMQCINEAVRQYGNLGFERLTAASHDAAWQQAWEAKDDDAGANEMSLMTIAASLANGHELVAHIQA
ncbi:MAG: SocA family protein [Brachymonas sp.]|nr:SocA family protein [Brachymonas sp.]